MKLLLTSGGITNKSIVKALFELVGKAPKNTSLVFIPTASNVEVGDKSWLIDDLNNLKKLKLKSIDIVDIATLDKKVIIEKFNQADILFFEGGNSYYLMEWINKTNLDKLLPDILKNKVYVGVSAGSMITSKDLNLKVSQKIYEEDLGRKKELKGLDFVDFYILPHLNSRWFKNVRKSLIEKEIQDIEETVYAIDDNSALKIDNNEIEIISEGQYLIFNK